MSESQGFTLVLVNRGRREVAVKPGQNLLAALEEADVSVACGCRTGSCFTCGAQLLWGRVHMEPGHAVSSDLLERGVFLPCISTLESNAEVLVGGPGKPLLPKRVRPWTE